MAFSSAERALIKAFTLGRANLINDYLRYEAPRSNPDVQRDIAILDGMIARSPLPSPARVYRGVGASYSKAMKAMPLRVGLRLTDAAYMSVSRQVEIARVFAALEGSGGLVIAIALPQGCPALEPGSLSAYGNEKEIILPRNSVLRFSGYDAQEDCFEADWIDGHE